MSEPSTFVPVDPQPRGQAGQDRTAGDDTGDRWPPTRGRASRARARRSVGAVLSGAGRRVDAAVSRDREPGEGARVFIDGAPSPADIVDRVKAGPPGGAEWPRARVVAWQVWMLLVPLPMACVGHGWAFVFGGVLRSVAALILLVLFVVSSAVSTDAAPAPAPKAPAVVGVR